jgi:hypothetical protein
MLSLITKSYYYSGFGSKYMTNNIGMHNYSEASTWPLRWMLYCHRNINSLKAHTPFVQHQTQAGSMIAVTIQTRAIFIDLVISYTNQTIPLSATIINYQFYFFGYKEKLSADEEEKIGKIYYI